jgi:ribosomal protein S18 acetylase RimI-like enzyme
VATVRRAEARDADAVLALIAGLGRPEVAEDPEPQRTVFLDYLAYDDALVWVAEAEDGALLGVISLWMRPRLNWVSLEGWIPDLFVAPESRRQGLARALLDAAATYARRRGCHRLVLEARTQRKEAHALYASYGFKNAGRRYELQL